MCPCAVPPVAWQEHGQAQELEHEEAQLHNRANSCTLNRSGNCAATPTPATGKQGVSGRNQSAFRIACTASAFSKLNDSSGGMGPIGDHHTRSKILCQSFMQQNISILS